jgi:hypothetical protein
MNINLLLENGIKPSTARIYRDSYNTVIKHCFSNKSPEYPFSQKNIQKLLNWIDNIAKSDYSKNHHLRSYIKVNELLGHSGDLVALNNKIRELNNRALYAKPTQKEIDNIIDINYIIQKRDEYKSQLTDNFHTKDAYYLLLSLYTYLPPLRSEDYYNTVIKNDNTNLNEDNYYDIEKKQLVLNHYKTSKTHGQRIIDIPNELAEIIKNFHNKSNSNYLICTRTCHKFDACSFNNMFKRCLNKKVSSSLLRKCFVSNSLDLNVNAEERIMNAKIMGHTVGVQQLIYSKYSNFLHPNDNDINNIIKRKKILEQQLNELNNKLYQKLDIIICP